ncbi:MAG: formylglycine-generating enzyme family protein [Calditrichaceae bacterium]
MKRLLISILFLPILMLVSCTVSLDLFRMNEHNPEKEKITGTNRGRESQAVEGMSYIPGGLFEMGSTEKSNESPVHSVYLNPFYMDTHEVTVSQFREYCIATGSKMPVQPEWNKENHPVVNVTWGQANDYAKWVGKRLPTEAEWEFAARAAGNIREDTSDKTSQYRRNFGNVADETMKKVKFFYPVVEGYYDGYINSAPVGSFVPNGFGLYDMIGNVTEWCADWYEEKYFNTANQQNPKGADQGRYKVIRGSSWNRSGDYLRVTYRTWFDPTCQFDFLGFRCVMDVDSSFLNKELAHSDGQSK